LRALPNNKWRNFVEFYVLEKPGYGAQVNAARRAGFGRPRTTALNMARIASRLMRDDRILARLPRRPARSCAAERLRRQKHCSILSVTPSTKITPGELP